MLNWANRFSICCFLDNQLYESSHHSYECLLGAGVRYQLKAPAGKAFDELKEFQAKHRDWLFGHLGYDLKNELFPLTSSHPDPIGFPDMFFFVPEIVIKLSKDSISIGSYGNDHTQIFERITSAEAVPANGTVAKMQVNALPASTPLDIRQRFTKEEYLQAIEQLKRHILRGDCYEINFCQQFFAENAEIDPLQAYKSLSELSPNPFSAFYKTESRYLLCASPERYLKKEGSRLWSQPIKGTTPRDRDNRQIDLHYKDQLFNSPKDRSENVMVVDLVRNDLAIVCEEGSVQVDELFGIYSFPQVHQMISTVSGVLRKDLSWIDAIKATFPMGSMTGAPKRRVLELIEQYEVIRRGVFSGAVGYITPEADFDFNVVIRSIFYNAENKYVAWLAGGGITFYSDAEQEYEESLLKAKAIRKIFEG